MATPEKTVTNERGQELVEELACIGELRRNPVWQRFVGLIGEKLKAQRGEHENPKRHPLRRAEHLHAVLELEALTLWLGDIERKDTAAVRRWAAKVDGLE